MPRRRWTKPPVSETAVDCQQACVYGTCRKTMDDPYGCGGCCSCLGNCMVAWELEQERLSYPRLLRFGLAMRVLGKLRTLKIRAVQLVSPSARRFRADLRALERFLNP
jgi:MinD superfamily P-loop ATPase